MVWVMDCTNIPSVPCCVCSHVLFQCFPHWLQAGPFEWEDSKEMEAEAGKIPVHLHSLSLLPIHHHENMSRTGLRVDERYMEESQRHPWPTKRTHELTIYTGTFPAKVSRTTQLIHRLIRNNKWCCQRHRIWGVVCYTALVNTLGLESKTQKVLDYKHQKIPLKTARNKSWE